MVQGFLMQLGWAITVKLKTLFYQASTNLEETKEKISKSLMINGGTCISISPDLMRFTRTGFIADLIFEEKENETTILITCSSTWWYDFFGIVSLLVFLLPLIVLVPHWSLTYSNFQTSLQMAGLQTTYMMYNKNLRQSKN